MGVIIYRSGVRSVINRLGFKIFDLDGYLLGFFKDFSKISFKSLDIISEIV